MRSPFGRSLASAALLAALAGPASAAATITIVNMDGVNDGFNDPTPAAPVGGNPGTTIGQQRLNCFAEAANIWGMRIDSSVPILIQAQFNPLSCTATSGTLGSAGPRFVEANDPSFEFQNVWYHEALANKQAEIDLTPPFMGDTGADINATFNANIGTPGCLTTSGWYYGFDHNEGALIDLLAVLLHEFGHGLGFSTTTNGSTGSYFNGPPALPALWDKFLYDEGNGLHWDQNSAAQRAASAISNGNLTWDGALTTAAAPNKLSLMPELLVPFGGGALEGGGAAFGGALTTTGITAQAILVNDGAGTTSDACEAPFVNAAALAGKIAVIDRGTCTFVAKALNAQNNGAIGVVIVNNAGGPLAPGGTEPAITIPVMGLTLVDGNALKTAINGGVTNVTMHLHPTRRAGTHPSGRVRMYSPNPFLGGSSVSHFDVTLAPNALMEPAINPDLTSSVDMTVPLFRDIGWIPRMLSTPGSGPAARVAIASAPNPTKGPTVVNFDLATEEAVELALYDVAGRQVRMLAKGRYPAGPNQVSWDGRDERGRVASPGIYLARLKGTRTNATQTLVLVD
jgi:hypothetical protein